MRQTHGAWEREFSFDQSEGCFKPCEDETTLEHGVLTIVLKRLGSWYSYHRMGLFDGKIPPNSIKFPWFIMVYRVVSNETLRKTVPRKWGVGKARNLIRRSDVPESGSGIVGVAG